MMEQEENVKQQQPLGGRQLDEGERLEAEPCLRRHSTGDLACQPTWRRNEFYCGMCGHVLVLLKTAEPAFPPESAGTGDDVGEETREYWEKTLLPDSKVCLPDDAAGFVPDRNLLPESGRHTVETEADMRAAGNRHAKKGRLPVAAPRSYDPYWRGYQEALEQMTVKELVLFQSAAEAAAAGAEREWTRRAADRLRLLEEQEKDSTNPDVLDVIAGEIWGIGKTYGWDNFGKMVERLIKGG